MPDLSCTGCGVCCLHMRTPPFLPGSKEWTSLPKRLRLEVLAHAKRDTPTSRMMDMLGMDENAPCIWYDMRTGKCREHARRPQVCREFEIGGLDCIKMREKAQVDDD